MDGFFDFHQSGKEFCFVRHFCGHKRLLFISCSFWGRVVRCEITGMRLYGIQMQMQIPGPEGWVMAVGVLPGCSSIIQYRSDFSWQPQTRTVIIEDNNYYRNPFVSINNTMLFSVSIAMNFCLVRAERET